MDSDFDGYRPRRKWPWIVALAVAAFVAGMVAAGYAVTRSPRIAAWLHLESSDVAAARLAVAHRVIVVPPPAMAPAAPPSTDPALVEQISALSEKVDDLETQARAATGDASRAEGLLVAFAARRALDRGVQLGYIEGLLRERFGHGQPEPVAAILSAARQPVTLADLQNGLDQVAPTLAADGDAVHDSWWQSFRRELAGMVVIRRADQPSPLPADRVARAGRMLEAGQVDGALAEVMRLPNHNAAAGWIVAARRYLAGRGALDRIETAALLEPAPPQSPGASPPPSDMPAGAGPAPTD